MALMRVFERAGVRFGDDLMGGDDRHHAGWREGVEIGGHGSCDGRGTGNRAAGGCIAAPESIGESPPPGGVVVAGRWCVERRAAAARQDQAEREGGRESVGARERA